MSFSVLTILDTLIRQDIFQRLWEHRPTTEKIDVQCPSASNRSRSKTIQYDAFAERFESPGTHRREETKEETFHLRMKVMIAQDQIEQLLLENKQQRDDSQAVEEELRATIRANEERHNRWNSNQSDNLRRKDEELRRCKLRIRDLLALLRSRKNNCRFYLGSMMAMKEEIKELSDEKCALKEETRKMIEEVDTLSRQIIKYQEQLQPKRISSSPSRLMWPWRRLFPNRIEHHDHEQQSQTPFHGSMSESAFYMSSASLMSEFQQMADQAVEAIEMGPGAEGDNEWSNLEEAEARERLFARQSTSEPDLASVSSSGQQLISPQQSPSCQFTNRTEVPDDECDELEIPGEILHEANQ